MAGGFVWPSRSCRPSRLTWSSPFTRMWRRSSSTSYPPAPILASHRCTSIWPQYLFESTAARASGFFTLLYRYGATAYAAISCALYLFLNDFFASLGPSWLLSRFMVLHRCKFIWFHISCAGQPYLTLDPPSRSLYLLWIAISPAGWTSHDTRRLSTFSSVPFSTPSFPRCARARR